MSETKENQQTKGKFIVFEGPDGFGKTTQAVHATLFLKERLGGLDRIALTKEPGSLRSQLTKDIRQMLFHKDYSLSLDGVEQGLLFFIDHYHNAKLVESLIQRGIWVISDRWLYSQYAYEPIKDQSQDDAMSLYRKYEKRQVKPDLVFILALDKEEAYKRIKARDDEKEKETTQSMKPWAQEDYLYAIIKNYGYLYYELEQQGIKTIIPVPFSHETSIEVFTNYIKPEIEILFGD